MIYLKYCIENIHNLSDINSKYLLIKKEKQNAIDCLKNLDDKKRSILGEKLLIDGLKNYYNVDYNDIAIKKNKHGKPYISNLEFSNIKFNISHSHDYSICAFSNHEIGVDIEMIRKVNINILDHFATNQEKEYILSSNEHLFQRLFTIFTLKEAYFKMLGEDLSNIKNVEFTIKNNNIICSDPMAKFKIINNIYGYIIAICERI